MRRRIIALLLCVAMIISAALSLSSCSDYQEGTQGQSSDLMSDVRAGEVNIDVDLNGACAEPITDFAVKLFRECLTDNQNTLVSPLSVISALAMTANGADGNTLAEMENVFGTTTKELNDYLHAYMNALNENEHSKLSLANSIWLRDDESLNVAPEFLQTNADYYNASIYKAPFDQSTLEDINEWVEENTAGMIRDILDEIPRDAIMYLVNALAFDAQWLTQYEESQVKDGDFTNSDSTVSSTPFMYSEESKYLKDDNAVGFIKYYEGREYAFAALLPDEGISLSDYVQSLTGERLRDILNNAKDVSVDAAIPKFETEYDVQMQSILSAMGMPEAFDPVAANFTRMATSANGNIYIGRVLHKTFIGVNELGTKAGAATVVEMRNESAMDPSDMEQIHLNRPFLYMLIDCEANMPVFIGALTNIEG